MAWLEVETKVKLKKEDLEGLRERIKNIARFVEKEKRADDYFAIKNGGYPKRAFRVRKKGDEFQVNFKKWLKNLWSEDIVVKQEFEFNLKGREHVSDLLALFRDLGFIEWVKKRKYSESYVWKKDKRLTIEMNKVAHLGWFLEIEYLCQRWEMQEAKKKIRKVLTLLGIDKKDIDNTGYTRMLWDKGIKDKRFFLK